MITKDQFAKSGDRFYKTIAAIAPITGTDRTSDGDVSAKFDPKATQKQRDDANAAILAFDWSDAAQQAYVDAKTPEKKLLLDTKTDDAAVNAAYLALQKPDADQQAAQLRALTEQMNRVRGFTTKVAEVSDATVAVSADTVSLKR